MLKHLAVISLGALARFIGMIDLQDPSGQPIWMVLPIWLPVRDMEYHLSSERKQTGSCPVEYKYNLCKYDRLQFWMDTICYMKYEHKR